MKRLGLGWAGLAAARVGWGCGGCLKIEVMGGL